MSLLVKKIQKLKEEKNAVILAHYYVNDEIQEIADYIGDSYYLSKIATEVPQETIVLCGVTFMGESAKLLNPQKTVLIPDAAAHCPMADMAGIDKIDAVKNEHPDVAVVCYINSTAELKAHSDVCVTSANALKIVKALPNKNIYFIPDENLGRFVASQLPGKNFIFNDGFCHVHADISKEDVLNAKELNPNAKILVHPECTPDVVKLGDYVGSTSGIIQYATESSCNEFIICTEIGVLYQLKQKNPHKHFYTANSRQCCSDMKKISLENVYDVLKNNTNIVVLKEDIKNKASFPLKRMLELGE
ncbi:quinolinate synthase NadA [Aminipila sp.]|uniref:quinolinate synthase NadA n=1 Tax=Aminipila sp. TaxID=2060095 RepID=UPI00289FA605|nr:quinolinate synthase NadA [Aminipila sp.]